MKFKKGDLVVVDFTTDSQVGDWVMGHVQAHLGNEEYLLKLFDGGPAYAVADDMRFYEQEEQGKGKETGV